MITTVTINPSVDKTYIVKDFEPFELNRATRIIYNAGSKGINVSRVVTQLGRDTCVLGFVGGQNGEMLLSELKAEGINEELVRVDENSRLNIKIMDTNTRKVTEVNETGSPVSDAKLNEFMQKYESHMKKSSIVVISGSILPSMSKRIYFDLITIANKYEKPVFLDCGGTLLKEAIKASPYCIKPNVKELADMLGKKTLTEEEVLIQARGIIEKNGVKCVVVTLGGSGAIGVTKDEAYKITPPNVEVISTVGAGDAFLAGLCHGYMKGLDFSNQLILATSCANAKVAEEGNNVPSFIELLGYVNGCNVTSL